MSTVNVDKVWTALPSDYCFESYNQLGKDIIDNMALSLSAAFTYINRGSTEPSGNNQNYLWFNQNDQKVYEYIGGNWVNRHPIPVGSGERRIWTGSEAELWSYDGGDGTDPSNASNVSDTTGSFWKIDTSFAARMPLGVGTLPLSSTAVSIGGTGGADQHALTTAQMPAHAHTQPGSEVARVQLGQDNGTAYAYYTTGIKDPEGEPDLAIDPVNTTSAGGSDGSTEAHQNMPPYLGVYFVERTPRVYYVAGTSSTTTSAGADVYFGTGAPSFTPANNQGIYIDTVTRDIYVWSTTTNSWTL